MQPQVVFVDHGNRITSLGHDTAEPPPGTNTQRGDQLVMRD